MADYPPFMNAYGQVSSILEKIRAAQTPPRFTQDFLKTKLGQSSGSSKAFIPLAKRLNLIGSDGVPTALYHRFRNPTESGSAMADAIRSGYSELFTRNEYAHELPEKELKGLVMEVTGLAPNAATLRSITQTFIELCRFAEFDGDGATSERVVENGESLPIELPGRAPADVPTVGVGLSYTINLNLPETTDVAVFNAIFKSLRENLLKR